jgi:hypothetical protein
MRAAPLDPTRLQRLVLIDTMSHAFGQARVKIYPDAAHGFLAGSGAGSAPKPVTLPAGKLRDALGIREVSYTKGQQALALTDQKLT